MPTNTFKRCLSNFLNSSRKQDNAHESRRINLSTVSNHSEPIFTTWMALSEIIMTTFSSRSPTYFLLSKVNTKIMHPSKPLINYDKLLNGNPVSRSKYYKMLPNIQAGDFDFVHNDNTVIKSDKVCYDDCTSKIIFTLQENKESKIDCTIEQESTDDLSICTTAKNVSFLSLTKSEFIASEIKQQQSRDRLKSQDLQKYDSSPSPKFRNYTQEDLFSSTTTEQRIQQRPQTSHILQMPTVTAKPLPSLFEILQQSNMIMKTQECTKYAAKPSVLANIGKEIR